jgi:hypothetical protein
MPASATIFTGSGTPHLRRSSSILDPVDVRDSHLITLSHFPFFGFFLRKVLVSFIIGRNLVEYL